MLLLYTDGLIERRGEPIDAGLAGPEGYADDVAMVAVRPCGTTATSHVDTLPAAFSEMAAARRRLGGWLRRLVPDQEQADRILLCAGEALVNAIEHGSDRDPDRAVTIEAFAEPDAVTVSISDTGGWAKDSGAGRAEHRGRGLTLIHGLADRVETARASQGTRVTITCRRPLPDSTLPDSTGRAPVTVQQ